MNKKSLLIISSISLLLLCGCSSKKKDPYIYPETETGFSIDYSLNESFQEQIKQLHLENGGAVSEETLSKFFSILVLNDFYANRLTLVESKTKYYVDKDDNPIDGDYRYSKTTNIARDNDTHSLSGTLSIKDESWTQLTSVVGLTHINVETTGTYSLIPNATTELGTETIDCLDDHYDSTTSVGYSEKVWSKKMNLTQSSEFGEKVMDTLSEIKKANETLSSSVQYKTTIVSYKDVDSTSIKINSFSVQPINTTGKKMTISYSMSVDIFGDMVSNTKYQYTIVEQDTNDNEYVVLSEYSERRLSYEK